LALDLTRKPRYDKTCCVHAEWAAILDGLSRNALHVPGSTLYFMRVDMGGNFVDAPDPFCTVCSRLTMAARVAHFVLWDAGGANSYRASEYNQASYAYYAPS
jgi:hypothetical protein